MALICTNWKCKRANPDEAAYCYFDGIPLAGASSPGPQRSGTTAFPWPLLLLSGDWCHSFDDLLQVIQRDWTIGVQALQNGLLADFFGHIGRSDLAQAARTAASRDDIDLGMNELLAVLPSQASLPPRLQLTRSEIDLSLEVGQETSFDLRLANEGQRMLCGAVRPIAPGSRSATGMHSARISSASSFCGAGRCRLASGAASWVCWVRCPIPTRGT